MRPLLHLLVRSAGVKMRSFINGVPLGYDDTGGGFFSRIPLNEWLMPSRNRVDLDVSPPPARDPSGSTDVEIAVCWPEEDSGPAIPPLQRFQWKMTADEEMQPFRVSFP